jgi:hypothetical protein
VAGAGGRQRGPGKVFGPNWLTYILNLSAPGNNRKGLKPLKDSPPRHQGHQEFTKKIAVSRKDAKYAKFLILSLRPLRLCEKLNLSLVDLGALAALVVQFKERG